MVLFNTVNADVGYALTVVTYAHGRRWMVSDECYFKIRFNLTFNLCFNNGIK